MKKRVKISLFIISILLVLSIFTSFVKFGTANPISAIIGLYKITFTDTKYIEIQKNPKVIIAKPYNSSKLLYEYMQYQGYFEEERLGAISKFTQGDNTVYIEFSVNKYFSLWKWIQ